ncbi:unnamed protein product, partial [Meganyctiphanes norvegica]
VPDSESVLGMVRRERELVSTPGYQRAASLPFADRRALRRQVRLRVVREFNLPDSVADVLESASYQDDEEEVSQRCSVRDEGRSKLHPPEFLLEPLLHHHHHTYRLGQGEEGLSEVMPDVALASSSLSVLQQQSGIGGPGGSSSLEEQRRRCVGSLEELQDVGLMLDLGDGSHHQVGSHMSLGSNHRRHSSRRRHMGSTTLSSSTLERMERVQTLERMDRVATLDRMDRMQLSNSPLGSSSGIVGNSATHLSHLANISGHHTYSAGGLRASPHTPPLRPHSTTTTLGTTATTPRHHTANTTPPLFL